ncbi:YcaO-like family protein [Haladaptatus cibarius]|uniref:YcaO-like family protein n=1 Tax=Haladaptatus cibarius TaxID=453847 RepID=UPI000679199E|nr:YcaO-like family protein [Haladaptatus cibarius]
MQPRAPVETAIEPQFMRLLGNRTGIVNGVHTLQMEREAPDASLSKPTTCDFAELADLGGEVSLGLGGKGKNLEETLMSSIGETVERYCLCWPEGVEEITEATYEEMQERETVVEYEHLDIFSEAVREEQLAPFEYDTPIYWTSGTNMHTGEEVHIPAEHVWMSMGPMADRPTRFMGTSNGCAAGGSLESAILGSIYELVERDAFMQMWARQDRPNKIDLDAYPRVKEFRDEHIDNEHLDVTLVDFGSSFDIPAVGAITVNQRDETPNFMLGGGAAVDLETAMIDALVETIQGWPYATEMVIQHDGDEIVRSDMNDNFDVNVLYYARPENFDDVSHLLEGDTVDIESKYDFPADVGDWFVGEKLDYCLDQLEAADCTPVAFDLGTRDVEELGFRVTRVFIPELVMLSPPSLLPANHPQLDDVEVTDKPHPYP